MTTDGLGRTDSGSLTVDRNALVERWVETFGLDLASPIEGALVVQEVGHVASLVDAAVAAERERIAETLRAAAAGRREYAPNAASLGAKAIGYSELLEIEAGTIDAAARVVEGDIEPLYGWLPSWRWTDEMVARLYPDKPASEREASFDRHSGDGDGRKPLDAYPTDQTGVSGALRARQNHSDLKETR